MKLYKTILCPICNCNNYKVLIKGKKKSQNFAELKKLYSSSNNLFIDQIVLCKQCSFIYTNPRINNKIIISGYTDVVDSKFISQDQLRLKTFNKSLNKIMSVIDISRVKIGLDVGTAGGAFLIACKNKNLKVEGIEPSKWLVNKFKKKSKIKIYNGAFENFSFKKKYDIIFFWDVLEHVFDLKKTIQKTKELLNANGYLIINAPDYESLARKILQKKWPFFLSVHLYYFTLKSLNQVLGRDFVLVKKFPHFQFLELGYILQRAKEYFSIFSLFQSLIIKLKLNKIPFLYNLGQTTFIYKNVKKN
jgi:2-polyprenyl-3-methyl-5-hydroxy-6-metoxy-1,4-benzoquinol methylase